MLWLLCMNLVYTQSTHSTETLGSQIIRRLMSCVMNIRSFLARCSPLCISYLHVKINQNHVWPISVKTTFPLMNSQPYHRTTIPCFSSDKSFSHCKCVHSFLAEHLQCAGWFLNKGEMEMREREIWTRFMHNYSNVTFKHSHTHTYAHEMFGF